MEMEEGQSDGIIEQDQNLEEVDDMEDDGLEEISEPKVGMLFDSEIAARVFCTRYAKRQGFGVSTIGSKNVAGVRTYVTFGCHKNGKARKKGDPLKAQPTQKTNCQARFLVARQQADDKWKLSSINNDHNHKMDVVMAKYLRCNRKVEPHVQRELELNCATGIKMHQTMNALSRQVGGSQNLTWTERDARNYMNKVRRHELKGGDAQAMTEYFGKMQADNNDFFYLMDLDDERRLRNVFWADARSREAYKEFGDVVTFDTTYLVNRFDMPFAVFVGVNHHGQSTLFGCALVTTEDTESFVWLFKAWLCCMSDRHPVAIITDQCRAMQNAIKQVFPNTRHRWCLWHIMKKVPEKFKGHEEYEGLQYRLKNAVYDSLSIEEFEDSWAKFIERYKLEANEWLRVMYDERNRWVPAFVKDTFWAGMSTTQRSESVNAFFDGYVHSSTTLAEFALQYENALRKKVQKEEEEDARCFDKQYYTGTPYGFEEQFLEAYTVTKFYQFREQIHGLLGCELEVGPVVDGIAKFSVEQDINVGKEKQFCKTSNFIVHFNEQTRDTNCNCRLFESKGMVCTHMIRVWKYKKLSEVPEKYILHRWRKGVIRRHTKVKVNYTNWQCKPEWNRLDRCKKLFNECVDGVIHSEAKTNWFEGILRQVIAANKMAANDEFISNARRPISAQIFSQSLQMGSTHVGDPSKGPRRVRASEKRKQTIFEQAARKKAKSNKKDHKSQDMAAVDVQNVVVDVQNVDIAPRKKSRSNKKVNTSQSQDMAVVDVQNVDIALQKKSRINKKVHPSQVANVQNVAAVDVQNVVVANFQNVDRALHIGTEDDQTLTEVIGTDFSQRSVTNSYMWTLDLNAPLFGWE